MIIGIVIKGMSEVQGTRGTALAPKSQKDEQHLWGMHLRNIQLWIVFDYLDILTIDLTLQVATSWDHSHWIKWTVKWKKEVCCFTLDIMTVLHSEVKMF